VISTVRAKELATHELAPGDPRREAIVALPDLIEESAFDAILPILLRLLRARTAERGGP
jgi:hypothetical protein